MRLECFCGYSEVNMSEVTDLIMLIEIDDDIRQYFISREKFYARALNFVKILEEQTD